MTVKRRTLLHGGLISLISLSGCYKHQLGRNGDPTVTPTKEPMKSFDATEPDWFSQGDRLDLERSIHDLVNRERTNQNYDPLRYNEPLAYIARAHSRDMAIKGYFAHTEPDGDTLSDRLEKYGYNGKHTAENIVKPSANPDTSIKVIAGRAVHTWMTSQGHRENILVPSFKVEGIGAYVTSKGSVYVTQVLMNDQ